MLLIADTTTQWSFSLGSICLASAILVAAWKITSVIRLVVNPIREFVAEHNVLWEDYNIRTGGGYRRSTGRGAPPEPEDFYRKHPIDPEI